MGVGVGVEFWELVAYWVIKVIFFTLICFFLGWLGLRVLVAFAISLLLAVGMFNFLDRLTPKIPFSRLRESSLGTGVYVLGYFVFLGLITHAAFAAAL